MCMKQILIFLLILLLTYCKIEKKTLKLAQEILDNQNYTIALNLSYSIVKSFNAGSSYPEFWIRDINTFIEVALKQVSASEAREVLLKFCEHQQENGTIIDGFLENKLTKKVKLFKNSVETDQETSLIQAFYKYITITNDYSILDEKINGLTALERLRKAQDYLLDYKFDQSYGLIFGATTIDWGDVQPEDVPGVHFDEKTHPAIDIYDNAMWVMAINSLIQMSKSRMPIYARYLESLLSEVKSNIQKHLWSETEQKYIPHIYLSKGSPFDGSFDESQIYFQGGTQVACEAGLLSKDQILVQLKKMEENMAKAGNIVTIGLTIFPSYPNGTFANHQVSHEYSYQNGGDWSWFGGRMIYTLIENELIEEANTHLKKIVDFVVRDNDYNEWYNQQGIGKGSWKYHGSAGVVGKAILMIQQWAELQLYLHKQQVY